jgi:hypothetical protein
MAETTCPDCKSEWDKMPDCERCDGLGTVPIRLEPDHYGPGKGKFFIGRRPTTVGRSREELRTALCEIAEELNCTPRRPG